MIMYFSLNNTLVFFISLTVSSLSSVAIAETVDISDALRCDSMVEIPGCIPNGESASQLRQSVNRTTGIVIPTARGSIPKVQSLRIDMTPPDAQVEAALNNDTAVSPQESRQSTSQRFASDTGAVGEGARTQANAENNNSYNSPTRAATTGSGGSSLNFGSGSSGNYGQSGQLKAGGFLYSDDDADESQSAGPNAASVGTSESSLLGQSQANGEAAVKANQKNAGSDQDSPFNPTASSSGGFGQFESGSSATPVNQGIVEKVTDGLASIAGSLGEKFFGALGGRSRGKSGAMSAAEEAKAKAQAALKQQGLALDKNLLKRRLARFNGQAGGHPEFGSAQSFLFNSMCNHYVAYARNNRIPNDRSPCPRK